MDKYYLEFGNFPTKEVNPYEAAMPIPRIQISIQNTLKKQAKAARHQANAWICRHNQDYLSYIDWEKYCDDISIHNYGSCGPNLKKVKKRLIYRKDNWTIHEEHNNQLYDRRHAKG